MYVMAITEILSHRLSDSSPTGSIDTTGNLWNISSQDLSPEKIAQKRKYFKDSLIPSKCSPI
jgi:hypothetical protein